MNRVCSCSSEDCRRNGCILDRALPPAPQPFKYAAPISPDHGGCKPLPTLTEAEVRRIAREETLKLLRAVWGGEKP